MKLVLDAFKGHLLPETNATITGSFISTDFVITPGEMNSQLWMLDVVVTKLFKDHLKQTYSR